MSEGGFATAQSAEGVEPIANSSVPLPIFTSGEQYSQREALWSVPMP